MMVRSARHLGAVTSLLLLAACGRTDGLFQGTTPTGTVTPPAPVGDAGVGPIDGGIPDGGAPPDAGPPPADLSLGVAMSCELDEDEALRAAARFVACTDGTTMSTVMDAHEGFALGAMDPFAAQLAGLPGACGIWQCAVDAESCGEFGNCLERTALSNRRCDDFELVCDGDMLGVCLGPFVTPHIDCGALGATCERGACVRDGCRFGNGETEASCNRGGGLQVCDLELDCTAWREAPASCASFFVGGEIPVPWCSPDGVGSVPGAYETPVDCDRSGVVTFTTLSGREHRFDCRDEGYRRCNQRGCVD